MDYLSIPLRIRASKRANDPGNFARYPEAVGGIWTREGKGSRFQSGPRKDLAWIDADTMSLRFIGSSDFILPRLQHKGWYVDQFREDITRGVVYRLPGGRGFVAGCSNPWNCDKSGRGPFLMENESFPTPEEAARRADRLAELYGEFCVEDDAKQTALIRIEEARAEISDLREEARGLVEGIRLSTLHPSVCERLRKDLKRIRAEAAECWARIAKLERDPWEAVA